MTSKIAFDNNGEPLGTFSDGVEWLTAEFASVLGVYEGAFSWDAATETFDGDAIAVLMSVMNAAFGDDWQNKLNPTKRRN